MRLGLTTAKGSNPGNGEGVFFEVLQADVLFAAFDLSDVGSVQAGYGGKHLLGETLLFAKSSYVRANTHNNATHETIIDHIGRLIHEIISSIFRGGYWPGLLLATTYR